MIKDIRFKLDALSRMAHGVNILARTVGSTLGPGGRNVIYEWGYHPQVTKDGVTVARQVELKGKFESIGANMVKDVADKTCDDAGDGTTTATILADSILTLGLQHIISGVNPIDIQRDLTESANNVVNYIRDNIKRDITSDEDVKHVTLVSANWDENIAEVVSKAILGVGVDGAIEFEDTKQGADVTLRFEEGMTFDRGYLNPAFVNNQDKMSVEYDDPYVLLHRGPINSWKPISRIISEATKEKDNGDRGAIVIIADDFETSIIQSALLNISRAGLKIALMKAPFYSTHKDNSMDDLAVFLNTSVYAPVTGWRGAENKSLDNLSMSYLGKCKKFIQTQTTSTFIGGAGAPDVERHIKNLQELKNPNSGLNETDRANIDLRIKKLKAKVAFINIGAHTEAEQNERRDRIDDAICAARAALKEGIVPGGCYAYLKAIPMLKKEMSNASRSKIIANTILIEALKQPFKRLMANVGLHDESYIILEHIIKSKKKNWGFDVKKKQLVDLAASGIADPFRVTRAALQNAVSIAGLMLTSEAVIAIDEDPSNNVVQAYEPPTLFS